MQEVFEKIIEKLNSKKVYFQRFYECEGKSEHDADLNKSTQLAFDDAIEIVKQEAEKCKSIYMDGEYCWQSCWCTDRCGECNRLCNGDIDYYESYDARNNGWIPCSERLPEEYGDYLVAWKPLHMSAEDIIKKVGRAVSHFYEIVEYDPDDEALWIGSSEQAQGEYEIIAWQPLPEPYHPKFIQECANPVSQEEREELNKNIRTIPIGTYQTNADRIRAMSDDELAGSRVDRIDFYTKSDIPEYIGDFEGIANSIEEANKLEIAWLQSEVEE